MIPRLRRSKFVSASVAAGILLFACTLLGCNRRSAQQGPVELKVDVKPAFRFVAYGDARFHDPRDIDVSNPSVRLALVTAIADANPAFICFTGDIVYNGYDGKDWKVWDEETAIWREKKIRIFPALGNHDLHGDSRVALGNYFARFPALKGSRYYSLQAANVLFLTLDSSLPEITGAQGQWLEEKLDHVPSEVDFVFLLLHHPPYTSSSESKVLTGGHSARPAEQELAKMLEQRQAHARFRIVVVSGHVHNYERHEHGGVTYFVSGGGAAHAYPIARTADDLFKSNEVNYHYLLVEVKQRELSVTMNRLDLTNGAVIWTQPDSVKIVVPGANLVQAAGR